MSDKVTFTQADIAEYHRLSEKDSYDTWTHDYDDTSRFYDETKKSGQLKKFFSRGALRLIHSTDHLGSLVKAREEEIETGEITTPLDIPRVLETIDQTKSPGEAIQTYIDHFPAARWKAGKVNAEVATTALVSIHDKFDDELTEKDRAFLATEAAGAVIEMANGVDSENGDVPTPPSVYTIVDVLDLVEEAGMDEDQKVAVEDSLKKVLHEIEKNPAQQPLVQPIEQALDYYDDPETDESLGVIVRNFVGRSMSVTGRKLERKVAAHPEDYDGFYAGHIEEASAEKRVDRAA